MLDMASGSGYLEIYNNTPYHIKVDIRGSDATYGPYRITANPPFYLCASCWATANAGWWYPFTNRSAKNLSLTTVTW